MQNPHKYMRRDCMVFDFCFSNRVVITSLDTATLLLCLAMVKYDITVSCNNAYDNSIAAERSSGLNTHLMPSGRFALNNNRVFPRRDKRVARPAATLFPGGTDEFHL
jgi:hypothetical protein